MSQPPTYNIGTDFSDDETNNEGGRSTVGTAKLDTELINIKNTLDAILSNLALLQRDDLKVKDAVIEPHTLSPGTLAIMNNNWNVRGLWTTATNYEVNDVVAYESGTIIAVVAHLSGDIATDVLAGKWILVANSFESGVIFNDLGASVDFVVKTNLNDKKLKIDGTNNLAQIAMGIAPTSLANIGGRLFSSTVSASTTAVTTEETLHTYTLPANSFSSDGKSVRIGFFFTTASNTESKTVRIYFGSTVIYSRVTTTADEAMLAECIVKRTSAGNQLYYTPNTGLDGAGDITIINASSEDETANIEIKATGQSAVATAGNITSQTFLVEAIELWHYLPPIS